MELFDHSRNRELYYYYTVCEFVTTFGADAGKNEAFPHVEYFKGHNLIKSKMEAEQYYYTRLNGLQNGKYFLPFASPEDFIMGENACFSITMSLIESYSDEEEYEYPLLGEDEETIIENKKIEQAVLESKQLI